MGEASLPTAITIPSPLEVKDPTSLSSGTRDMPWLLGLEPILTSKWFAYMCEMTGFKTLGRVAAVNVIHSTPTDLAFPPSAALLESLSTRLIMSMVCAFYLLYMITCNCCEPTWASTWGALLALMNCNFLQGVHSLQGGVLFL